MQQYDEIDAVLHGGPAGPATILVEGERLLVAFGRESSSGAMDIITVHSSDFGQTWYGAAVAAHGERGSTLSNPSLVRVDSGGVLLAYLDAPGENDAGRVLIRHSYDDGATWSSPRPMYGRPAGNPARVGNDRFVRLPSGRVLLPVLEETIGCVAWMSDDGGRTWTRGAGAVKPPEGVECATPVSLALLDGLTAMLVRCQNAADVVYTAHSPDDGQTWEMFNDWGPPSLLAPFAASCAPNGDLVLLSLNHSIATNLTVAVSRDCGRYWDAFRLLEGQQDWPPSRLYSNPSVGFANGIAHITYVERLVGKAGAESGRRLIYRRLPMAWFVDRPPERPPVYDVVGFIRAFVDSKSIHDPKVRALIRAPFNPASVPK